MLEVLEVLVKLPGQPLRPAPVVRGPCADHTLAMSDNEPRSAHMMHRPCLEHAVHGLGVKHVPPGELRKMLTLALHERGAEHEQTAPGEVSKILADGPAGKPAVRRVTTTDPHLVRRGQLVSESGRRLSDPHEVKSSQVSKPNNTHPPPAMRVYISSKRPSAKTLKMNTHAHSVGFCGY
jgi:hypothetical protein